MEKQCAIDSFLLSLNVFGILFDFDLVLWSYHSAAALLFTTLLAWLLSFGHFDVDLDFSVIPVRILRNQIPLVFINRIKNAPATFQRMINTVISEYYRKFCCNFWVIAEPLTMLLRKDEPFIWSSNCQQAFEKIKSLLVSRPVLMAPKPFKLMVDASDVGCGAVLLQEDDSKIDHPVSYFSYKFNTHQKPIQLVRRRH